MDNIQDNFKLLCRKEIYEILDGDIVCGQYTFENGNTIDIKMPYLKGNQLCNLSSMFGLPQEYGSSSRWMYVEELFKYCVKQNRCSDLLCYLFNEDRFQNILDKYGVKNFKKIHNALITQVIDKINSFLYLGKHELVNIGNNFIVKSTFGKIDIPIPQINKIDRNYIKNMQERADKDVEEEEFDSAITKAKTLLEEVFKYVLENRGIEMSKSISMSELYRKVREEYGIKTGNEADTRVNKLISGLNKIVDAVVEMRNIASDSHGLGSKRISVEKHHALLVVNAASIVADFILAVANKNDS